MADTTTLNGKQSDTDLTPEQYKELCKQVRHYQLKKGTKKKQKPLLKPIGDINVLDFKIKVQKSLVDWDTISNGTPFAIDPNGTLIYIKSGKERALCWNTMSPVPIGGAAVYRVFL